MATKKARTSSAKPTDEPAEKRPKPRKTRDYAQRGYDTVREVERRHAERHPEEKD
jgi:hypothetical protein